MPINMRTFYQLWGIKTPEEAREKVRRLTQKYQTGVPSNAKEMALSRFGKTIYRKLIKGYTEKQWGRKCTELSPDILSRIPIRYTFDDNYFNDIHQGIPVGGYTEMVERMLRGTEIRLNTNYIDHREELDMLAEKIVYTGPLDELMDYCLGPLEYRSLYFDTEMIDREYFQGNAVVNYTERYVPFTRVIEHKFFAYDDIRVQQLGHTIVTREYPVEWHQGAEPYYPISDEKNLKLYGKYRDMVANLPKRYIIGGRLAEYKYYNMDKVIERALEVADAEL